MKEREPWNPFVHSSDEEEEEIDAGESISESAGIMNMLTLCIYRFDSFR